MALELEPQLKISLTAYGKAAVLIVIIVFVFYPIFKDWPSKVDLSHFFKIIYAAVLFFPGLILYHWQQIKREKLRKKKR